MLVRRSETTGGKQRIDLNQNGDQYGGGTQFSVWQYVDGHEISRTTRIPSLTEAIALYDDQIAIELEHNGLSFRRVP